MKESATTNGALSVAVMGAINNSTSSLNGPLSLSSGILPSNTATTCSGNSPVSTGVFSSTPGGFGRSSQPASPLKSAPVSSGKDWINDSSSEEKSSAENLPTTPKQIGDLLANPLGQTVSGRRGAEGSALKIRIPKPSKSNGKNALQPETVESSRGNKSRPTKQNGFHGADEKSDVVGADGDGPPLTKKGRKRNVQPKEKGAPRGRAKSSSVVSNGDDQSPTREPPVKKAKVETARRQQRDVGTTTVSMSQQVEPELLGPLEPGSSITLDGIVWRETPGGILVINVTWRGKTYVGSLLDCSKHNWVPPGRICDTPPSDGECSRSSNKDRLGPKRARNGPLDNNDASRSGGGSGAPQTLRGGKTRRGANFQTPSSPACSESGTPGKPRGKGRGRPTTLGGPVLRGSEPRESVSDVPSPDSTKSGKRGRRAASGSSTPGPDGQQPPLSPVWHSCPGPQCEKKYSSREALRYHLQQVKNHGLPRSPAGSSFDDEHSSDSLSDPICPDSLVRVCTPNHVETPESVVTPTTEAALNVTPSTLPVSGSSPTIPISTPQQSHLDMVLSAAVNLDGADDEARQRNKQRRKQSNPVSSQQKRGDSSTPLDAKEVSQQGITDSDAPAAPDLQDLSKSVVDSSKEIVSDKLAVIPGPSLNGIHSLHSNGCAMPPFIHDLSRTAQIFPAKDSHPALAQRPEPIRLPATTILDSGLISAAGPLDLKMNNSPLLMPPMKIGSPLAMAGMTSPALDLQYNSSIAPSENKISPVNYEDISSDDDDDAVDTKKGPERTAVGPAVTASTDKPSSAYSSFTYGGFPPPYMTGSYPTIDPDRSMGSPADATKSVGPMNFGVFPSTSPLFMGVSRSPQPVDTRHELPARASPVSVAKPRPSDRKESDKSESGKPVGKDLSGSSSRSSGNDSKPDGGYKAIREELKGPLEDVTGTHNKMHSPAGGASYPFPLPMASSVGYRPPGYIPSTFHGAMYPPPLTTHPMFMGDQHPLFMGDQYFRFLNNTAFGGAGGPMRGGPSNGVPPGMSPLAGVDLTAIPQRIAPVTSSSSSSSGHKIHELKEDMKSSENKKPSSRSSSNTDSSSPKNLSTVNHHGSPEDRGLGSGEYLGGMTPYHWNGSSS